MKCPYCKNEIPSDSKFCPDCGKPIKGTSEGGSSCSESGADTLEFTIGGVSFNMIRVEHGEFMMGATDEQEDPNDDEKPVHKVMLTEDYYIGETQVTQELWAAVMCDNPSWDKGETLPVHAVSWDDCKQFILKLNFITDKSFRLPTEAEWEFASRGGNKSKGYQYSGSHIIECVAWHKDNSKVKPHPVAEHLSNELGIYDMSGNVWEWCQDWYGHYNEKTFTNPVGLPNGTNRVLRGGSCCDAISNCRLSCRRSESPNIHNGCIGFRLALSK